MSNYGDQPADGNSSGYPGQGEHNPPYGQQSNQQYGQQPGSEPSQGAAQYGAPGGEQYGAAQSPPPYAHWGRRVAASLIDVLLVLPGIIVVGIGEAVAISGLHTVKDAYGHTTTTGSVNATGLVLILVGTLYVLAIQIWNIIIRQGRTGQSVGKKQLGIRVISEETGHPLSMGMNFVRQLAHVLDSLLCYLGYLWPLWDAKRQTFADKVMSTVVIDDKSK